MPTPFYMPTVEEVLESIGTASVISKLDLNKGYYQVKVRKEDVAKMVFVCHEGHFEFLRMPFGLKNAPAAFQKLTSRVLESFRGFARPYIDDIIVFSDAWDDHVGHVREMLARLRESGLTANPKKCKWGGKVVEFLGHKLGEGKMSIPNRRVEAIRILLSQGPRSFSGHSWDWSASTGDMWKCWPKTREPCLPQRQGRLPTLLCGLQRWTQPSATYVSLCVMPVHLLYLCPQTSVRLSRMRRGSDWGQCCRYGEKRPG